MTYLLDTATWGPGNFMPTQEELNKIRAQIVASDDEDEFIIFTRAVRNHYGLHITGVEQ
jgi:hypothetical protein